MLLARNAPKWHEWKASAMASRLQVCYTINVKYEAWNNSYDIYSITYTKEF